MERFTPKQDCSLCFPGIDSHTEVVGSLIWWFEMTCGINASTSVFPVCHQCLRAGSVWIRAWIFRLHCAFCGDPGWKFFHVLLFLPSIGWIFDSNNIDDGDANIKGAFWDFVQSPHHAMNCLQCIHSSGQGTVLCKSHATRQALITCMSCATWYEGTAQLLKFDRVEITFISALFH